MIEAKEMTIEIGVEVVFREKLNIWRKNNFDENDGDEVTRYAEEYFMVTYLLISVGQILSSLKTWFEQFLEMKKNLGFCLI